MLELKDICVSFQSERQDKLFGTSRDQVLFDVSLQVEKGSCLEKPEAENRRLDVSFADF